MRYRSLVSRRSAGSRLRWFHVAAGGIGLLVLLVLVALLLRPDREVWDPFQHVGPAFSNQAPPADPYDGYRKDTQYLELTDGTRLAADIFLPGETASDSERFPVVLQYTPYSYGRSFALTHLAWWERIAFWWQTGKTGKTEPILDQMLLSDLARYLVSRGYAFVAVEMRGTGASFGRHVMGDQRLGRDGKQVVEWMAQQPWSNGRVAMHGQSYLTWGQLATAAERPAGLRCIVPEVLGLDLYTGLFRPGGILSERFVEAYAGWFEGLNLNRLAPDAKPAGIFPATPVVDEDGDGELVDEIPEMAMGDPTTFLDDGAPSYADGTERRRDLYFEATRRHVDNSPVGRLSELRFVDDTLRHLNQEVSFANTNPASFLPSILDSDIEMLVIGGWFDGPLRETLQLYASARPTMSARLLVGPRFHIPAGVPAAYRDYLGYEGNLEAEIAAEKVRFLHRCLKGEPGGDSGDRAPDKAGPVKIYVMHEGWRRLENWPPREGREQTLFLSADGRLDPDSVSAENAPLGKDTLDVDFKHSATYGEGDRSRWFVMPPGGPDSLMLRNPLDRSALVWETEPLENELTVIGHPIFEVSLSANRSTADVFVYLSEVDPDGRVVNVTEGQLRMNFHRSVDEAESSTRQVRILPGLPRHGFRSTDHVAAPLADGQTIEAKIDLQPTAWRFRAGHRIRVSVTGADVGNFELNPVLCPEGKAELCDPTKLYIHRGGNASSRLILPVHTLPQEEIPTRPE